MAEKFAAEKSNVAINYMTSKENAERFAGELASKHNIKAVTIQGVRCSSILISNLNSHVYYNALTVVVTYRTLESKARQPMPSNQPLSSWEAWILSSQTLYATDAYFGIERLLIKV